MTDDATPKPDAPDAPDTPAVPSAPSSPPPVAPAAPTAAPDDDGDGGDRQGPRRRWRRPHRQPTGAGDKISLDAFDELLKQYQGGQDLTVAGTGIIDPFSDHPVALPTETTNSDDDSSDDDAQSCDPDDPDDNSDK